MKEEKKLKIAACVNLCNKANWGHFSIERLIACSGERASISSASALTRTLIESLHARYQNALSCCGKNSSPWVCSCSLCNARWCASIFILLIKYLISDLSVAGWEAKMSRSLIYQIFMPPRLLALSVTKFMMDHVSHRQDYKITCLCKQMCLHRKLFLISRAV